MAYGNQAPPTYAPPPGQAPPPPPPGYGGPQPQKEGPMGLIAGILMILGAIGYLGTGIYISIVGTFLIGMGGGLLYICGAIILILFVIELLGGIFAIKREKWGITMFGAICGINVVAIILLIVGKEEFKS